MSNKLGKFCKKKDTNVLQFEIMIHKEIDSKYNIEEMFGLKKDDLGNYSLNNNLDYDIVIDNINNSMDYIIPKIQYNVDDVKVFEGYNHFKFLEDTYHIITGKIIKLYRIREWISHFEIYCIKSESLREIWLILIWKVIIWIKDNDWLFFDRERGRIIFKVLAVIKMLTFLCEHKINHTLMVASYFYKLNDIMKIGLFSLYHEKIFYNIKEINKCLCISNVLGEYMDNKRKQLIKTSVYEFGVGTYNECDLAISHCWMDMLLLEEIYAKKLCNYLIKNNKCAWLDLVQSCFNAKKCRSEYLGNVMVISKCLEDCPINISVKQRTMRLMLSEWARRGWVAQEVTSSKNLIGLSLKYGLILNLDNKLIKNVLSINHRNLDTAYNNLSSRVWRKMEDIWLTSEWWTKSINSEQAYGKLLPYIITNMGFTNINTFSYGYSWLPKKIDNGKIDVPNAKYIGNGRLFILGYYIAEIQHKYKSKNTYGEGKKCYVMVNKKINNDRTLYIWPVNKLSVEWNLKGKPELLDITIFNINIIEECIILA